jgi:hypothetical protein
LSPLNLARQQEYLAAKMAHLVGSKNTRPEGTGFLSILSFSLHLFALCCILTPQG